MSELELYINNTLADTTGVKILLNMAIADVKNPKQRGGTGSLTVVLPGTKTNNNLLTGIYDIAYDIQTSGVINFSPDFNPNLKASAYILCGGLREFTGYMKLLQINRDQQDLEKITYEVQLIGEITNLFASIGEGKLTDLSFSEFDHAYNKANQEATWTNTNYGTGYVYPMINYGDVANEAIWDVNNFRPAIYAKTYVDKIFASAGWVYDSTFFNSAFFKRLIIPFNGEKLALTPSQISARIFSADTSGVTSGSVTLTGSESAVVFNQQPLIYGHEISDPSGQYNPATGIFTCTVAGTYTFYTSGVAEAEAITTVTLGAPGVGSVGISIQKNAVTFSSTSYLQSVFTSYLAGQQIYSEIYEHYGSVTLSIGDTVEIEVLQSIPVSVGFGAGTITFSISQGSLFRNYVSVTNIVDGNNLVMSSAIPQDVKQADFLMGIIRLFNMYAEVDKDQDNKLIIDTEDNFYGAGDTLDWSQLIDVSDGRGVEILPMGALDAKTYRITYAQDTDYWNKLYTETFKETYGEKRVDVVNDFLKNTNTNEVLFAPTPLIGSNSVDRIIPEIYTITSAGATQPVRSKPRILYWAGAIATADTWSYASTVSGNTNENTYPYAGHLDNPVNPTLDLSIGVPRQVYYDAAVGTINYTNNNVYNAYHSKFIAEITDRNSKIVKAHFLLRPANIHSFSFRDMVYIDGQMYRAQKISEFNADGGGITKVELLRMKAGIPFVPTSGLVYIDGTLYDSNFIPDERQ